MGSKPFGAVLIAAVLVVPAAAPSLGQGDDAEARQLVERAQSLAKESKYDEAISQMRKALRLAPKNDQYWALTSELERRAGRFDEATEHALQAIRLNDKVGLYDALVAANSFANQDLDLARKYSRKALERGEQALGPGPYHDMKVLDGMLHKRTVTILWDLNPQKGLARTGAITVALPRTELPYQRVNFTVAGARSSQVVHADANDLLRIVPDGATTIRLTTRITTEPSSYKERLAKRRPAPLPREARAYLGAIDDINANSTKLARIVAGLRGKDDLETIRNILGWLKKNVRYKFEARTVWGLDYNSAEEIADRGYAECRGYTVLFVTLCRAAGVPARPIWGLAILPATKTAPKGDYGSHNWAEVYILGVGWVPVDPQKPETLGWLPNNDLRIFMFGRRSLSTPENLPLLNLLSMNGEHVRFEQER
jgi:tetratricopeptide (TPR) repeat protein